MGDGSEAQRPHDSNPVASPTENTPCLCTPDRVGSRLMHRVHHRSMPDAAEAARTYPCEPVSASYFGVGLRPLNRLRNRTAWRRRVAGWGANYLDAAGQLTEDEPAKFFQILSLWETGSPKQAYASVCLGCDERPDLQLLVARCQMRHCHHGQQRATQACSHHLRNSLQAGCAEIVARSHSVAEFLATHLQGLVTQA